MRIFYRYLKEYLGQIELYKLLLTTLFVAVLIFLNYRFGIEDTIKGMPHGYISLALFFILYLFVFGVAYLIQFPGQESRHIISKKKFLLFIIFAVGFFSFKMIHWNIFFISYEQPTGWAKYWSVTLQWPLKLLALILALIFISKNNGDKNSFWGLPSKDFKYQPYLLILLCMVPIVALASTQPDFLHTYPKLKMVAFISNYANPSWPWKLLYEIAYGLDFISIELFFRGFLVLGFYRFAGIQAILPMAAFYCTIHFGKPMGECISSYFGAVALGVIAYRTKSIAGGIIVHLGIAYLMEIGGFLGGM